MATMTLEKMAGGGFCSATDADLLTPDGRVDEGDFFTWTQDELQAVLGPNRAELFGRYYGVSPKGNFVGRNILYRPLPAVDVAAAAKIDAGKTFL